MFKKTIDFIKDIKHELYIAFYPSPKQIRVWFFQIVVATAIFSLIFFLMDSSLSSIIKELINLNNEVIK